MKIPLSRRAFLAGSTAPLFAQRTATQQRPNVVLVLADGLGAWMLGCYGNREIRTPGIDLLARSGTRFMHNSVSTPAGSAARATLFTGRVASQHGLRDALAAESAASASLPNEVMISDVLAADGYNCGYAGKWDMGDDLKPQHGFRFWETSTSGPEEVTAKATRFLSEQKAEQPFFLVVSYWDPREPYEGYPQKYYELYARSTFETVGWLPEAAGAARGQEYLKDIVGSLRKCAAAVTALDNQVTALVAAIDKTGLRDDTLVVFTSATGLLAGRHGLWDAGHGSDPVNMYQEAIEAPLVWNWPGHIPVEAARPEVVNHYDLFPSLCEGTKAKPPANRVLCGRSYLLLATNKPLPKKQPWNNLAFGQLGNTEMVRDSRYKLVLRNNGAGPNELYDLRTDPRELSDLYKNPQFVTIRDALAKELQQWRKKVS